MTSVVMMPGRLVLALALLLSACSLIKVQTDFDGEANFARYQTFQFQPGTIVGAFGLIDRDNTLFEDRVRKAVTAQLSAKGLRPVSHDGDLLVTYVAGAQRRTEVESFPAPIAYCCWGWWGGWGPGWWAPGWNDWWVRTYTEGTLIVDLIDASTKRLVWRAYTSGEMTKPGDPALVNEAMAKAFQDFPPALRN